MVGESEPVSKSFSLAGAGLFWIGGFLFIFLTIAVMGSLMNQSGTSTDARTSESNTARRASQSRAEEPSIGLSPQTIAPSP